MLNNLSVKFIVLKKVTSFFAMLILLSSCGISKSINHTPDVSGFNTIVNSRVQINDSTFISRNNHLSKNKQGLWELYVEGDAYEIGSQTGLLTQELFKKQEAVFLGKVDELVPSKFKQYLLRKLIAWYNRKMYLHIPEEYKVEIYGLSKYAANQYDHIANNYLRILYLHGAHDIGHALQDLALVGCSSFAVWGNKTAEGNLIIGRNFDFYAGDEFAKDKIIAFVNPITGYNYMSVTWGGMIGVVSGMNEHGLTVSINAGKSKIPLVAKTPISILTLEILQYAKTIDEAIAIAKKREVFVSESILIGSAIDNKAVTIEVSPKNFGVYEVENTSQLICSNHFQSDAYKEDENNNKHKIESHSQYRYLRMEELLQTSKKVNVKKAVAILRNKEGLENKDIGYGNEKALNQLLAHHGIVFSPHTGEVWVSSNPYQLGEFVSYNLNDVFNNPATKTSLSQPQFNIKKDSFQFTKAFIDYEKYRVLSRTINEAIHKKEHLDITTISQFQKLNRNYWETYFLVGKYYYEKEFYTAALNAFKKAKTKEITTVPDRKEIEKYIKKIKRKINL